MHESSADEFSPAELAALQPYFTNLDRPVFALQNLPEVVKGALFSRYSRTDKSLRRVLLEEFLEHLEADGVEARPAAAVSSKRAEQFYERVLVGYGDDSVAELAGAHLAVEGVSQLGAKSLEDSRIGISPLEKSTRYVRFDRPGPAGYRYLRAPELAHPGYAGSMDRLFETYAELLPEALGGVRQRYPKAEEESERAWTSATRAKALDILRGLLPASSLTNLGLYGNGRAFEYLITKLTADPLPECRRLALSIHGELSQVIPAFVRRALDERYGAAASRRLGSVREALERAAPRRPQPAEVAQVRLLDSDPEAEQKVVTALIYPYSDLDWSSLSKAPKDVESILSTAAVGRENRRQRTPRALEQAVYGFEVVGNFGAYRDLQRHRMLSQERQLLGVDLGYDVPEEACWLGLEERYRRALEEAARVHQRLVPDLGRHLAQYAVPLAFRIRWYVRANLREIVHLCELRTTPQGHRDYRRLAQQMFQAVRRVHPRLAAFASFVDLGSGEELERRLAERRIDRRLEALNGPG